MFEPNPEEQGGTGGMSAAGCLVIAFAIVVVFVVIAGLTGATILGGG